jgi:glutaredoxin
MRCPKCSYERKKTDTAPDWQCPACGVVYEKFQNEQFRAQATMRASSGYAPRRERPAGSFFKSLLWIGAAAVFAWFWYDDIRQSVTGRKPAQAVSIAATPYTGKPYVVMYSLTTCGHCVNMRAELQSRGIPFREHFLDQDGAKLQELAEKMQAAGFRGGGIGTPTLEVNGKILPNNPPIKDVLRAYERT